MTTRDDLLRSSLNTLNRHLRDATALFREWTDTEKILEHQSIVPVLTTAHRHLERDRDRLFVLLQSYAPPQAGDRTSSLSDSNQKENSLKEDSAGLFSANPTPARILEAGYQTLDALSTRYASVYSVARAVMEPPIANLILSNLRDLRTLMSEFIGVLSLVTTDHVMHNHQTIAVDKSAESQAQDLLRTLWAPASASPNTAGDPTELNANRKPPLPPPRSNR